MPKLKKYIIWIIFIAAIIGAVFYFRSGKPKTQYTTEEIRRVNVLQTVSITGEILAVERADLNFEISGKIKSINIKVGDEIKKSQEVARLEDDILRYQFIEAQRARDIQQENLDLARRTWDDFKPEEREAKKLAVRQAQAVVEVAGAQLAKAILYSPIDGIVARIDVEEGENVVAGSALLGSSTPFATLVRESDFEIDANVPESDITKVAVGQGAVVTFDALSSEDIFTAQLTEIEPTSTVIQDVVYYGVRLKLDNIDARFKDGMSADIDIKTAEKSGILAVPARAIKTEGEKKYVEIMKNEATQEIEKRYIQTGLEGDEGLIEIVSGLSEGEKVVTLVKTQ